MTEFSNIRRPPKDINLLFQVDKRPTIRSTTGFQKLSFLKSPPIGSPKYKKGVDPVLQFITIAASTNHEAVILTPVSRLLLKFSYIIIYFLCISYIKICFHRYRQQKKTAMARCKYLINFCI